MSENNQKIDDIIIETVIEPTQQLKQNEKTFTQSELDKIVSERLKRVKIEIDGGTKTIAEITKEQEANIVANAIAEYERKQKLSMEQRLKEEHNEHLKSLSEERKTIYRESAEMKLKDNSLKLSDDEIEMYLDMLVTSDKTETFGRIERFVNGRKKAILEAVNDVTAKLQGNMPNTQIGIQQANDLQIQYDNAKKNNNFAQMSAIMRNAQALNIQIKN